MWLIKLETLLMLIFTFELFVKISSPTNIISDIKLVFFLFFKTHLLDAYFVIV
jgi:hypothetical protein